MAIRVIVTHKKDRKLDQSWLQRFVQTYQPDLENPRGTLYVTRPDTTIEVVAADGDVDRVVFVAYADVAVHDIELSKLYYANVITAWEDDAWQIDAYDFEHSRLVVNNRVIEARERQAIDGRIFLTFVLE